MAAFSQQTFRPVGPEILVQAFNTNSTTQNHLLGERRKGYNATDGYAEFIYAKGVASTVAGSWVTINSDDWSTALLVANASGPVGVAMSACVASEYGWYCIYGKIDARAGVVDNDDDALYADTVPGSIDDVAVAGDKVFGAKAASDDDTGVAGPPGHAEFEIHYPYITDDSMAF
jgi:hypothetical protein